METDITFYEGLDYYLFENMGDESKAVTQTYWRLEKDILKVSFEKTKEEKEDELGAILSGLFMKGKYWLASRCVDLSNGENPTFGIRYESDGLILSGSNSRAGVSITSAKLGCRPVVSMGFEKIDLNTDYEGEGKWRLVD